MINITKYIYLSVRTYIPPPHNLFFGAHPKNLYFGYDISVLSMTLHKDIIVYCPIP